MSKRTKWPTWVTKTLKEEALCRLMPLWGTLTWAQLVTWVLAFSEVITLRQALYAVLMMALLFGGMLLMFHFAIQSEGQRRLLYKRGEEAAHKQSLLARHYIDWKWFAFGLFIILIEGSQPKRAAD